MESLAASVTCSKLLFQRLVHAFDGSEDASILADQALCADPPSEFARGLQHLGNVPLHFDLSPDPIDFA